MEDRQILAELLALKNDLYNLFLRCHKLSQVFIGVDRKAELLQFIKMMDLHHIPITDKMLRDFFPNYERLNDAVHELLIQGEIYNIDEQYHSL